MTKTSEINKTSRVSINDIILCLQCDIEYEGRHKKLDLPTNLTNGGHEKFGMERDEALQEEVQVAVDAGVILAALDSNTNDTGRIIKPVIDI